MGRPCYGTSAIAAPAEDRLAFLHEGAHAFGVIGGEACLALQLALELELAFQIVVPGFVKRALDEREPDGRRRGECGAQLLRLRHQVRIVDGAPDEAPRL